MAGLDDLQRMIFGTGERIKDIIAPDEAPTNYDLYDSEGNKIGTKQRTSSDQSFVGQTTVRDDNGKLITSGDEDFDRVMKKIVDSTTPKIRINGAKNGLIVSGTTEALEYAKAAKLNDYLKKTFQYANFADANVENAVAELNESLRESNEKNLVENAIGGNYDDYKEYKLLLQEMRGTNPTNSQVTVKGYDKDGNVQTWTIKQWIDYYKKAYNIGERQQLLADSYSKYKRDRDFKTWVPFIIMSGGGDQFVNSLAGANLLEKAGITAGTALSEVAKLGEGAAKAVMEAANPFSWHGESRKNNLNDIAHELGHKADVSLNEAKWITEDDFNKKIDSLVGKNVNDLTEDEAAFLAVALGDKLTGGPFGIGRYTKDFITEEGNDNISREQLEKATSYQDYINARDNLSTITKYKEEINEKNIEQFPLFKPLRDWSELVASAAPIESISGRFAGTMLRMWIESGLISGLTGGSFNPMNLSDDFAESLVGLLNKTGREYTAENLSTGIGKFFLMTAAEIPEDIIQTAIDDVMIGQANYIPELLTPESIEDNAVQNLIMRLVFTPAHAGYRWIKDKELIKNSAIAAKLRKRIPESWFTNAKSVQNAADNGKIVDLTENSATVINPDGTTTELDNVAMLHFGEGEMAERYPAIAEMLRKKGLIEEDIDVETAKMYDDPDVMVERLTDRTKLPTQEEINDGVPIKKYFEDYDTKRIDDPDVTNKIIDDNIPQKVQFGYYGESGDIIKGWQGREVMAGAALRNPELRNAGLNKAYDVYYRLFPDAERLSFEEWVNTPITLTRRFRAEEGIGSDNANVLGYSMRKDGLAEDTYGPETDTITIEPKYTTGLLMGADDVGFADEGEIFVPTALIESHPKYMTVEDIVGIKNAEGDATMEAAPSSASYRWESPDVTKTYSSSKDVFADMPTGKNMTETRQWMKNAEAFYMNRYAEQTMPEFSRAYPTIDEQQQFVRNMDYLFDLQKMDKETVESSIGKTYENEGVVYTVKQEDVDFYNNYVEPMMSELREAGAAGVGATPSTTIGYLPHSDYDPTILTAEDSMQQGVLWREYKGTSTTDDDGNFSTGWLNPDLTARYKTFVDNMLWDSLGDQVVIAKYMEEFNADGLNVAANTVEKMVGGRRRLAHLVSESNSVKDIVKHLTKDGEMPSDEALEKAAKEIGATNVVHDLYRPIYGSAGDTVFQDKSATSVRLNSKGDWMRSLGTGDGTLYDNGGAMLVNGNADAKWMAKQIFEAAESGRELDVKQMFVDYLMQNNRRTAKAADYIAEKWMDKIAQKATDGGISRRALTAELGHMIYGEGANRVFRFIGRMDTSKLTDANRQALDSLLYRHSALSKIKNTSSFSANFNKAANKLISARMKSLFWLNFKNGVLQASECIRLFTEFKLGDALKTIKRLSTDAEFRADVDEWVDMLVPERYIKSDSTAATGAMETLADNMSYDGTTLTVNKISADGIRKLGKDFDKLASGPVEMGEAMKNRILIAGILQEAERKGLSGNDMFSFVNQRFERIGLAANEMGRLNASDNPFFRIASNLKTFQIRQMRMYLNNINDMNGKKEVITYILKNVGWKGGMAVALAKLGYSATAVLGIDPFDLMDDDYTGVDESRYRGFDYVMLSPVAKLLLSGGFTGYISDTYWACRKAYEDNATITEQTEDSVKNTAPGFAAPGTSFDDVLDTLGGFIPGYTAGKRVLQMNDLMETGWALSSTGNRMYQAPTNPLDIAAGYAFGRSNTPNARAYYQTPDYLEGLMSNGIQGLGQQIGRELKPIRQLFGDTNAGYRSFDPVDSEGYTDWFNGTAADEQQWASGYYYFRNRVDEAQRKYQESLGRSYSDEDKAALRESFNQQLSEIEDQLNKFTTAYEAKHPEGIDAKKMRNLTNILNLYQPVMGDTEEEAKERELEANNEALYRYSQAGLPAVNSMRRNDKGEVEEVYSPQLRSALQGEYGLPQEAATQIRQLYKDKWKDLGKQYRDRVFSTKGTKKKQAIQKEYINIVRQDLDPIVSLYGNNIWNNEDVENIIDDVFNSMIPKYGQSAKSYLKGIYKDYAGKLVYTERGNETLTQINKLLDQGKTAQAKALARSLKQRVQENKTSLNRSEMERLQRILND